MKASTHIYCLARNMDLDTDLLFDEIRIAREVLEAHQGLADCAWYAGIMAQAARQCKHLKVMLNGEEVVLTDRYRSEAAKWLRRARVEEQHIMDGLQGIVDDIMNKCNQ